MNYQIAAIVHGDDHVVDSCFHADGRMLVTATRESIQLIDSLSGEPKKKLFTKTHGNANVVFTHHEHCILASSRKTNNDIRYLSTYDNRYLRFFKGHQSQVTSLTMSPVDDYFLSSSSGSERAVCLWSLASPAPVARLALPSTAHNPQVAYTHDGLIFGVLSEEVQSGTGSIRLFDARSYDKGPFLTLQPTQSQLERALKTAQPFLEAGAGGPLQRLLAASRWQSFCFSPDGTRALVSTSSGLLISLDAFSNDGTDPPVVFFTEERSASRRGSPQQPSSPSSSLSSSSSSLPSLGYCCTPDSKQVLAGTDDKKVRVYDMESGRPLGVLCPGGATTAVGAGGEPLDPLHVSAVTSVRCNPKYEVIATSGINTMLWLKNKT